MILFDFFEKQKEFDKQKKVTQILINTLKIPDIQKSLFLDAINILDKNWMDKIYFELTEFIKEIELKELEDISKNNFTNIAWMQKKEAETRKKDLNAFSLLLNNV